MIGKGLSFISRISVRLLAFNLLLVFLPVAGFLYLDTYERQLLQSLEHALVQQGRILAAGFARGDLIEASAQQTLVELRQRHEARFRIIDTSGRLLADSSRLGPRLEALEAVKQRDKYVGRMAPEELTGSAEKREIRLSLLYRIATIPIELYRKFLSPPPRLWSRVTFTAASIVCEAPKFGRLSRVDTARRLAFPPGVNDRSLSTARFLFEAAKM